MTVLAPSSYDEVATMLGWALRGAEGPVAIRWPKTEARLCPVTGEGRSARLVREGTDVCLIGVGKLLAACEEAAASLEIDGVSASVWDPRAVTPLDPRLVEHAAGHRVVVVAEDGVVEGGAGSLVASALQGRCGGDTPEVACAGVPVAYLPHGKPSDILASLGLDGPGIAARVLAALRGAPAPVASLPVR